LQRPWSSSSSRSSRSPPHQRNPRDVVTCNTM
jgi:hypothetical protein